MSAIVRRAFAVVSLLPVALAAAGCAPIIRVRAFTETGVVFNFRTYSWAADNGLATGDPRLDNNRFFIERVRDSVDHELAARGFEKTGQGSSDLVIHFHATITQEIEITATDRFDHCYNCGSSVYDAGTLVIDLVDARSSRLVWRGWAEKVDAVIENQDWMEETIDRVVAQILKKLPPRAVQVRTASGVSHDSEAAPDPRGTVVDDVGGSRGRPGAAAGGGPAAATRHRVFTGVAVHSNLRRAIRPASDRSR